MNLAKDVIIRDAFGDFKSKREVIDLASEDTMESGGEEEEGADDVCAQHTVIMLSGMAYLSHLMRSCQLPSYVEPLISAFDLWMAIVKVLSMQVRSTKVTVDYLQCCRWRTLRNTA